jgi:WD40 repeat protein
MSIMAIGPRSYQAFISYSHSDHKIARWLHQKLEGYNIHSSLVGQTTSLGVVPRRVFPVFLDREEIPTSSDLGETIRTALVNSRCLIVICSPKAAHSHWVNEECLGFKKLHGDSRIIGLIAAGEPNAADKGMSAELECFPAALRFRTGPDGQLTDQRVEPIAADIRPGHDTRQVAFQRVLAGMLGVDFDTLRQREKIRRRRRLVAASILSTAMLAVVVALSVTAISNRRLASENGRKIDEQKGDVAAAKAAANSEQILRQEKEKLANLAGFQKRHREYLDDMQRIPQAWKDSQTPFVHALLDKHRPGGKGDEDQRGFEWYYWWWLCYGSPLYIVDEFSVDAEAIALSPDGRLLAMRAAPRGRPATPQDGAVVVWDMNSSKATARIVGDELPERLAFSPDGTLLAGAYNYYDNHFQKQTPGTVWVWNARSGELRHKFQIPPAGPIKGLGFSPDGNLLACSWKYAGHIATPNNGGIRVWDLRTRLETVSGAGRMECENVEFTEDGKRVAVVDQLPPRGLSMEQCALREWDTETGKEFPTLSLWDGTLPLRSGLALSLSPDCKLVVVDRRLRVGHTFDNIQDLALCSIGRVPNNNLRPSWIPAHIKVNEFASHASDFVFSPNSGCLAYAHDDMVTLEVVGDVGSREFRGHTEHVGGIAFSDDGTRIATATSSQVRIWDRVHPQGQIKSRPKRDGLPDEASDLNCIRSKDGLITVFYVARNGPGTIVCRSSDYSILHKFSLGAGLGSGQTAAISDDDKHFVVVGGGIMKVWDLRTGGESFAKTGLGIHTGAPSISPDGRDVALVRYDTRKDRPGGWLWRVTCWDTTTGQELFEACQPPSTDDYLSCQSFNADGSQLALCSRGKITFLDVRTGRLVRTIDTGMESAACVAFSPDGRYVAAAGGEPRQPGVADQDANHVKIWDLTTGKEMSLLFKDEHDRARRLQFTADSERLAIGLERYAKGTSVWDFLYGEELLSFEREQADIEDICGVRAQQLLSLHGPTASARGTGAISPPSSAPATHQGSTTRASISLSPPQKERPLAQTKPSSENHEKWLSLLNGENRAGWEPPPDRENDWRMQKGVLRWTSLDSSHLWTQRDDYRNFELNVEARVSSGQYAQLILRDTFGQQGESRHRGYAIVLNSDNGNPCKTGSLLVAGSGPVCSVPESRAQPGEWFTLEVSAEGSHLVVKINGRITADYSDPKKRFDHGHITALAVNRERVPQRYLELRNLKIRELPAANGELPKVDQGQLKR